MSPATEPDEPRAGARDGSRPSVLGPGDPDEMAMAADELRHRTMRLEESDHGLPWRLVATIVVVVFVAVALALKYRAELRHAARSLGF